MDERVTLSTAEKLIKLGFREWRKQCPQESHITQTAAAKWLREEKNLHVDVYSNASGWEYVIDKASNGTLVIRSDYEDGSDGEGGAWDNYETCLEAGITRATLLITK